MNPNHLPPGYHLHQRYSIQKCLGQGGFGITYLAYDQKLEQEVCIKELFVSGNSTRGANLTVHSQTTGEFSFPDFVQRFIQEAKQLARFQHPNIVRVIDIFEENHTAYTVMEFIAGETLKEKIQREGAMNTQVALKLIAQLLDAVEEVHAKGMLHRDIKPDNILLSPEGRVVLIDFGSARDFTEGKTTTQTAMLTPGYSPIEQYSNRAQRGPYTDIYALGATIYYLITGEKPLAATDRNLEELKPPHLLNPKVSSQISSAVLLAMDMKPENRFQQIKDMREALSSVGQMEPQQVKPKQENPKQEKLKTEDTPKRPNLPPENSAKNKKKPIQIITTLLVIPFSILALYLIFPSSPNLSAIKSIEENMVWVEGGSFKMGCTSEQEGDCWDYERPAHRVELDGFFISKYEVTQEQWLGIMGNNPSSFNDCRQCPVEKVNYKDIEEFIQKLNQQTGKNYRLPTEAEWEYAARGGNQSQGYKYSGSNEINEVAWHKHNADGKTHPVGQKSPNELDIYDMSGNVWEWCSDWEGEYNSQQQINPQGSDTGIKRIGRGGSWVNVSQYARVSFRSTDIPKRRGSALGFRLASSTK